MISASHLRLSYRRSSYQSVDARCSTLLADLLDDRCPTTWICNTTILEIFRLSHPRFSFHAPLLMTPAFPITEARIVGLFVESVTYGINLVSFGFCLNALLGFGTKRKRINEINWPMTIISILIFVVSTLGICLAFWIVLRAFVFYAPSPSSALSDISYWALSAKVL